ncbi:MAG: hypothetical protein WCP77_06635 [Roseococcus sp.]
MLAIGLAAGQAQAALFDEFEVHDLDMPAAGEWDLDQHVNWGTRGLNQPGWPGGVRTNGAGYVSTEIGRGITRDWTAALYLPAVISGGRLEPVGAKLRNLFRFYGDDGDGWSFGLLAQIGLLSRPASPGRVVGELRPVVTWRSGPWYVVAGMGVSAYSGPEADALLSPQGRLTYTLPSGVNFGLEHYADLGAVGRLGSPARQTHQAFATLGAPLGPVEVNFGIGRGLTAASEPWVARLRLGVEF